MSNELPAPINTQPLLLVEHLAKSDVRRGTLTHAGPRVQAAAEITISLEAGRTLGMAGSSGCGKSTVARCVSRIERPDEGAILFEGNDLARLSLWLRYAR